MSLFIQNDSGTVGSGSVFPDRAEADLLCICQADTGLGENAPVGDLLQVTYTESLSGTCPDRLNLLVNTNFGVNPSNIDIIVVAVDGSFTLNDGTLLTNNAGLTFPVGSTDNPTGSVLVVYDTSQNNGLGYCVKGLVSGNQDLIMPNSVILYHELSHALRDATNSSLSLAATGCAASPEENAAETDENDMRTQLGIPLRDSTDHCGGSCSAAACGTASGGCLTDCSGTTTCCVVASIATGSPYSAEVNAMRQVRDKFLRRSYVGFSFFDKLFYDYYGFSPEVCRLMAFSPALRERVEKHFVRPLTLALSLIHAYTLDQADAAELGRRFEAGLQASPELSGMSSEEVFEAVGVLDAVRRGDPLPDPTLSEISRLLSGRAMTSEPVRWALMDTVAVYARALVWRQEGVSTAAIGERLATYFDEWAVEMPFTDVWSGLAKYEIGQELAFLQKCLLRTPQARMRFAERLVNAFPDDARLPGLLAAAGYTSERRPS